MAGMLDLFLFLFAFAIVGAGIVASRILGLALTLVSWSSFALSLKYGGSVDVRVGYMSILAWMLAMGGVLVCRMSGRKQLGFKRIFGITKRLSPGSNHP